MTEAEYLASVDPGAMLAQFVPPAGRSSRTGHNLNSFPTTDRRLRLFACACWRVRMGRYFKKYRDYSVSDYGEAMADGREFPPERPQPLLGGDWDYYPLLPDAASAARRMCENACPEDAAVFANMLRCLFGNPFRPVQEVNPAWMLANDRAAGLLAEGIYEDREWKYLPILADALEEAGATDPGLLGHLRADVACPHCRGHGYDLHVGPEPGGEIPDCRYCCGTGRGSAVHARGCWVLDLLLGKE